MRPNIKGLQDLILCEKIIIEERILTFAVDDRLIQRLMSHSCISYWGIFMGLNMALLFMISPVLYIVLLLLFYVLMQSMGVC